MNDPDETSRLILRLDLDRANALVRGDIEALDRMTGDSYTHVESSGKFRNKAEFLDSLCVAGFGFDSFVIEENAVRLFGDTAIVTGRYHNQIRTAEGAHPVKNARHIRIYVRSGGEWKIVAHQATQI